MMKRRERINGIKDKGKKVEIRKGGRMFEGYVEYGVMEEKGLHCFLENRADVNMISKNGNPLFFSPFLQKQTPPPLLSLFLENKANLHFCDSSGNSLLHLLALSYSSPLSSSLSTSSSSLSIALSFSSSSRCSSSSSYSSSPYLPSSSSPSPYLSSSSSLFDVMLLLIYKIDPSLLNMDGLNAQQIALRNNFSQLYQLLQNYQLKRFFFLLKKFFF